MPAFQKLIYEVDLCWIFGDSTIQRIEEIMALIVLPVILLQGYSAGNWGTKVQTQSDFWGDWIREVPSCLG